MLPRSQRLSTETFREVFAAGRLVHSTFFTMRVRKSDKTSHFAVSVSKKVAKTAVERNRIRRRTYAALRDMFATDGKTPLTEFPVEAVLVAKNGIQKLGTAEISSDIRASFVKNGILK